MILVALLSALLSAPLPPAIPPAALAFPNGSPPPAFTLPAPPLDRASSRRPPALPAGVPLGFAIHGHWSPEYGIAGFDGDVYCALEFGGDIVVGGRFRHVDGQLANGIARWDGSAWHPMGDGFRGDVFSLGTWRGRLVAGGSFFVSGMNSTGPIAYWDGAAWQAVDDQLYGTIFALAGDDTTLVAGGYLWFPGDTQYRFVALHDGTHWNDMLSGVDGVVNAITPYAGGWAVGGSFGRAGGAPAGSVALWKDGAWSDLSGGVALEGRMPFVSSLATRGTELLVGGQFGTAGGIPASGIARWDGHDWSSLPGAPSDLITLGLLGDGDVVHLGAVSSVVPVGGVSPIARWDGVSFAFEPGGPNYPPSSMAVSGGRLMAVGYFVTVDGRAATHVALRTNGTWSVPISWSPPMHGLRGPVFGLTGYRGSPIAVGGFRDAADDTGWVSTPGVARWDGNHWRAMGDPGPMYQGDVLVDRDELYLANGSVSRWTGSIWTPVGAPMPYPITELVSARGSIWGASAQTSYHPGTSGLYRLDGDAWTSMPSPPGLPRDSLVVAAFAEHAGKLAVAWSSGPNYWTEPTHVFEWDGSTWGSELGRFTGGPVRHLASFQGHLVATGGFGAVDDGPYVPGFALLEPQGWTSRSAPISSPDAVLATDSVLFVSSYDGLVAFNGSEWAVVDSGETHGPAAAMTAVGSSLWLGGDLLLAGGRPASGVARYDLPYTPPRPPQPAAWIGVGENPSRETTTLHFSLARAGRVRISILDLGGRTVRVLADQSLNASRFSVVWDGTDDNLHSVASGVYFARIELDGEAAPARKFVRAR